MPPCSPALDRSPAHLELGAQRRSAPLRHAVQHRRHEHDDDTEIQASTEKAHRWRRRTSPAPFASTAEAEALRRLAAESAGSTSWLARVVADVERTAAVRTARSRDLVSDLTVNSEQRFLQTGASQQSLAQRPGLLFLAKTETSPPTSRRQARRGGTFVSRQRTRSESRDLPAQTVALLNRCEFQKLRQLDSGKSVHPAGALRGSRS